MIPEILADLGYSEKIGSPGNDFLLSDSDTIVYGLQGDDALRTNDTSDPVGNSLLVGGRGSDRYIIDDEFQIIGIFDTGNSTGDILEASEFNFYDNDTFAYEVYNNTLVLFELDGQTIILPDWQNVENRIEEFQFEEVTLFYDELVDVFANNSDKYLGNFNADSTITLPNGEDYDIFVGGSESETIDIYQAIIDRAEELESENPSDDLRLEEFLQDPSQYIGAIRDFDGNNLGSPEGWKSIGSVDIQGDGDTEYIFVNPIIGRWASVGADRDNIVDFDNHGRGGDTRVVGIYIDPLVESGEVVRGSAFDSQRRFQNDLYIDNLTLLDGDDYDGDGLEETYFRVNDGTAVLHAYMHADGNIRYANYQSEADLEEFMTANDVSSSVWGDWFN
jgi:hypothetical protein